MYVVANKQKVPLKEVDEKEGWTLKLGFMDTEVSPWVLAGIIALVLFVMVMLYMSLSAVDTQPSLPKPTPAVAAPMAIAKPMKGAGKKAKGKKGRAHA
jgi:hypothetical protein